MNRQSNLHQIFAPKKPFSIKGISCVQISYRLCGNAGGLKMAGRGGGFGWYLPFFAQSCS
jgi:hypothetical protein